MYTEQDARHSLNFFQIIDYNEALSIGNTFTVTLIPSYHILGASFITVSNGTKTLTFSGDLGQPDTFMMKNPPAITHTDYLILESTYGGQAP